MAQSDRGGADVVVRHLHSFSHAIDQSLRGLLHIAEGGDLVKVVRADSSRPHMCVAWSDDAVVPAVEPRQLAQQSPFQALNQ